MARRLPLAVNSDHLTAIGALAMPLICLSYWLAPQHPAALVLVVLLLIGNWFGDSLDGTLARVRGHERPRYGFYVDHVLDAVGILFVISGLVLGGFMSLPIGAGFLIAYYLLTMIARAFSSMPGLASGIARSIRDGSVKKFLTQPVDMVGFLLLSRIAHKLVYYAVALLPFALVFYLCRDFFPTTPDAAGWTGWRPSSGAPAARASSFRSAGRATCYAPSGASARSAGRCCVTCAGP